MWPFTSSSDEPSFNALRRQYDFIIIGGGNAGCVLAHRLAEDGSKTVLLVEKGDAGNSWLHSTPLLSQHHFSDGKHSSIVQSTPNAQLGNRESPLVCGLGLGGSTRINSGQYTCGVPAQYNAWSREGRKGWSYSDLKPYFDKSERWIGPVPKEYHGLTGPLQVRSFEDYFYGSSKSAADAAAKLGFLDIVDMHSPLEPSIGFNKIQFSIDSGGRRQSAFRAYLHEDFLQSRRDNLHVCTSVVACQVQFVQGSDGSIRAESVVLRNLHRGDERVISARQEIVLACGALRTPQILLLSGIGPRDILTEMGINVVKHSPGVGSHLQDHLLLPTSYNCPLSDSLWSMAKRPTTLIKELFKYLRHGTGWFLGTLVEMEIFGMSSVIQPDGTPHQLSKDQLDSFNPNNLPDFAVMMCPIADPKEPGTDQAKGLIGIHASLLTPKSMGQLRLRSLDPLADPVCDMRYLTSPDDWTALRAALRVTVALANEMRANGYPLDDIQVPDISDEAAMDDFIRRRADTMYHYSSSCRMAPEDAEHPGVVDDQLRVHGIPNLRIADASVFPDSPAIHPQALVYAVAEKCADLIRRDASA